MQFILFPETIPDARHVDRRWDANRARESGCVTARIPCYGPDLSPLDRRSNERPCPERDCDTGCGAGGLRAPSAKSPFSAKDRGNGPHAPMCWRGPSRRGPSCAPTINTGPGARSIQRWVSVHAQREIFAHFATHARKLTSSQRKTLVEHRATLLKLHRRRILFLK